MRWLEGAVGNGVVATSSGEESSKRTESLGQCGVSLEYIRLLHAHSSRVMAEETKTSKFINDIVVPLTSYKHRYGSQGDIHVLRCGRVRIIVSSQSVDIVIMDAYMGYKMLRYYMRSPHADLVTYNHACAYSHTVVAYGSRANGQFEANSFSDVACSHPPSHLAQAL